MLPNMALRNAEKCKTHLDRICAALPETTQRPGEEQVSHIASLMRKKTLAYLTVDHHGDGRRASPFLGGTPATGTFRDLRSRTGRRHSNVPYADLLQAVRNFRLRCPCLRGPRQ